MVSTSSLVLFAILASGQPAEIWEFTAPWCGSCQEMKPVVAALQQQGAPIRELMFDQHRDLAAQAGVTALPTFLLVADGQIVDRRVGKLGRQQLNDLVLRAQQLQDSDQPDVRSSVVPAAAAVAQPPSASALSGADDVVQRAIQATVRLRIEDDRGISLGTGTIIDVHGEEALVLTCGHIFRDSGGKGKIRCDLFGGSGQSDLPAKLVSYDLRRDVALVSLRPGIKVPVMPVGDAGSSVTQGAAVFAVGCNRGAEPSVIRNQVLAVNRYHGPANLVVGGRPIDGRSGGGLFDEQGTVIGVCNAADQQRDEGLYAALGPIHAELDAAGLSFVYRDAATQLVDHTSPRQPADGTDFTSPADPATPTQDEFMASNAGFGHDTEVICVVRPRQGNAGTGQAYVLEQPSQDLLNQLSQEMSQRGAHLQTRHRQEYSATTRKVHTSPEGWE